MNPLVIGSLVFVCVFGAGMLALCLRLLIPRHHLGPATKDTVKLSMGLVATMAALVLGLLVASAKSSYDDQKDEVTLMASNVAFMDQILAVYGPESAAARKALYNSVERMRDHLWPKAVTQTPQTTPNTVSADALYRAITDLSPKNDEQRDLKARVLDVGSEVGKTRFLLFTQTTGSSVSMPLLVVVVCWLAVLFFSFGLFAPMNGVVINALIAAALSVAGAIFLVLEFDHPFSGLIQISSQHIDNVLQLLGR